MKYKTVLLFLEVSFFYVFVKDKFEYFVTTAKKICNFLKIVQSNFKPPLYIKSRGEFI